MTSDTDDFDAVVYDLDGTLVDLAVDWDAVAREVAARYAEEGIDVADDDLWRMIDVADEWGLRNAVEEIVATRERDGAERSTRRPLADRLPDETVPVGVCSLNSEGACRIALDRHDLAPHVDVVVGRDSVSTRKPDPEPLLAVLRRLDVAPERALFVGDGERDADTAERAGTAFSYAADRQAGARTESETETESGF